MVYFETILCRGHVNANDGNVVIDPQPGELMARA
jgi:hypothetical protein